MADPHIYIVAAEKSGNELGAGLVRALRAATKGNIQLSAIGGPALEAEGLQSPVDVSQLSILGLIEGLKAYPIVVDRVRQAREHIMAANPDAVVLIDSWGFMVRIAKQLKKRGFNGRIIKYVAPQVWAMREGRSKILAQHVDHLLTIHSFDAPYFTRHGLGVDYVGNPVFDTDYQTGDVGALRAEYNLPDTTPVLILLLGSRLSEIHTLAKPMADAVRRLRNQIPGLCVFSPVSDSVTEDVYAAAAEHSGLQEVIFVNEDRKLDCFAAANAAIACSGTVTTQLACAGVPTVVCYKVNPVTFMIARRIFKQNHISIVNIAAKDELLPELLQNECTGESLANEVLPFLNDADIAGDKRKALLAAIETMKADSADGKAAGTSSTRAAEAVLRQLA